MKNTTAIQICKTCQNWIPICDGGNAGDCKRKTASGIPYGATGAYYACQHWQPKTAQQTPDAPSQAAQQFDIEAAAARVLKMKLRKVSITIIQRRLNCKYADAAAVIQHLKNKGLLK